jgi:hypothetical protein
VDLMEEMRRFICLSDGIDFISFGNRCQENCS